jgi:hypothetical protein
MHACAVDWGGRGSQGSGAVAGFILKPPRTCLCALVGCLRLCGLLVLGHFLQRTTMHAHTNTHAQRAEKGEGELWYNTGRQHNESTQRRGECARARNNTVHFVVGGMRDGEKGASTPGGPARWDKDKRPPAIHMCTPARLRALRTPGRKGGLPHRSMSRYALNGRDMGGGGTSQAALAGMAAPCDYFSNHPHEPRRACG